MMVAALQSRRRFRGNAGFTMVEALVAFVVLATLTLAVQRGLAASIASTTRADERLGADLVARTLISAPTGTGPSTLQAQSGTMNGFAWTIRFEHLELPMASRNAPTAKHVAWVPVRMLITVSTPSGSDMKIETVRLVGG